MEGRSSETMTSDQMMGLGSLVNSGDNGSRREIPKNSFQSLESYSQALMEIPWRLADRITSRSHDQMEMVEVKARSGHEMKKTLNW